MTLAYLEAKKQQIFSNPNISFSHKVSAWCCFLEPIADEAEAMGISAKCYRQLNFWEDGTNKTHEWVSNYFTYILPDGTESTEVWGNPNEALAHGLCALLNK